MFGLGGHSGTATSVDTDLERDPPPRATIVYFPQNDVAFASTDIWLKQPPDLFARFSHMAKPSDINLPDLAALNLTIKGDVDLEDFVPRSSDGLQHLPPRTWHSGAARPQNGTKAPNSLTYEVYAHSTYPLLSNGTKAPELELFNKFVKELHVDTDDGLRLIGKRKPRPGHEVPNLSHYRKFWGQLETIASHWDTSLDHYYTIDLPAKSAGKKFSVGHKNAAAQGPQKVQKYKGRRTSNGAKMPEHVRSDAVRSFVEPLALAFGSQLANPRRVPYLQIKILQVPVTQTATMWRTPQDKTQARQGILEGPVMGLQCRSETGFIRDERIAVLDTAREVAGVILLAQERAREGKQDIIPGEGKWYTTVQRWGGGPGGEFGEAVGENDPPDEGGYVPGKPKTIPKVLADRMHKSEEEIWKELKPGPGQFEPRITYLAIGKERTAEWDSVFMISSIYHHISILRFDVHPLYLDFLITGKVPAQQPKSAWYAPHIYRTRWFDLLVGEDRCEAMRALWGVMSYMMRTGQSTEPLGQRQKSEIHHAFPFRRKHHMHEKDEAETPRSSSLAV